MPPRECRGPGHQVTPTRRAIRPEASSRMRPCGARIHDRGGDLPLLLAAWGCHTAIWYSCVSPLRTCLRRNPVLGEVDLRRPGAGQAWPCRGALACAVRSGASGRRRAVAASAAAGRRFSDVLARAGDGKVTTGALDVAGLSWTSWDSAGHRAGTHASFRSGFLAVVVRVPSRLGSGKNDGGRNGLPQRALLITAKHHLSQIPTPLISE